MADLSNHFFKFIKPNSKFNISIPRAFWEKLKETRCKKAVLKRRRHEWPVDISNEGVFCDGWKEFVRDNEVQEFDFIVFKHQGNYVFDFGVFDQSMCEREYSTNLPDEMDVEEPVMKSDANGDKPTSNNNHRSFITTLKPSSITKFGLYIPTKFSIQNGLKPGEVVLRDDKGRSWNAKLNKKGEKAFYVGYRHLKDLCYASELKEGDTIKFELIQNENHKPLVAKISPCVDRVYKSVVVNVNSTPSEKEDHRHVKKVKTIPSTKKETTTTSNNNHRSFISTIKPYTLTTSGLYIPIEFYTQNGLRLGEVVLKDDNGRSWDTHLNESRGKYFFVACTGLKDLCYANGLKEGDTIKFELVENENDKPLVAKISEYVNANSTPYEKEDHPYFIGEVKEYFQRMLRLPSTFVKKNGLFDKKELILKRFKYEKSWNVKLKKSTKTSYISGPRWKDFCVAFDLKEGDFFKLELVSNGEQPMANFYFLKIC